MLTLAKKATMKGKPPKPFWASKLLGKQAAILSIS